MGMMGVFLWTIGSVQTQTEEGGKKMTNRCHICGRMKPMSEATICDSCKDAMKHNGYIKVLRCKDCKHLINHPGFMDDGYCENMRKTYCLKFKPEDDWYCADGERRTDDD